MKTRFILGSALAAVLLMWGGTGKVMAQKNIDKMAAEQVRLWPRRILIKWRRNWKNGMMWLSIL